MACFRGRDGVIKTGDGGGHRAQTRSLTPAHSPPCNQLLGTMDDNHLLQGGNQNACLLYSAPSEHASPFTPSLWNCALEAPAATDWSALQSRRRNWQSVSPPRLKESGRGILHPWFLSAALIMFIRTAENIRATRSRWKQLHSIFSLIYSRWHLMGRAALVGNLRGKINQSAEYNSF